MNSPSTSASETQAPVGPGDLLTTPKFKPISDTGSRSCPPTCSDTEAIIKPATAMYSSIKDLLPASWPAPAVSPQTPNSSWPEVPIRNHLVKQAALAYLQPMVAAPSPGDGGLYGRFKDLCGCCGGGTRCGCLQWFNGIVSGAVRDLFGTRSG